MDTTLFSHIVSPKAIKQTNKDANELQKRLVMGWTRNVSAMEAA